MFEENISQQIKEDISRLVNDVADLRREVGKRGYSKVEDLRSDAQEKFKEAQKHAKQKARQIDEYAHEKPWVAVGIAAAIGAMLGAILSRKD